MENQRRRALRDSQGYYFPYKKYTLKDYRDMQKTNNANPFAETNETTIDRVNRRLSFSNLKLFVFFFSRKNDRKNGKNTER